MLIKFFRKKADAGNDTKASVGIASIHLVNLIFLSYIKPFSKLEK